MPGHATAFSNTTGHVGKKLTSVPAAKVFGKTLSSALNNPTGRAGVEVEILDSRGWRSVGGKCLVLRERVPGLYHLDQCIHFARFDDIGVCAQVEGPLHIDGAAGGSENVHSRPP